jgi:S1-C subfamily serine protease
MGRTKSFAEHALTALVILALAMVLLGDRFGVRRPPQPLPAPAGQAVPQARPPRSAPAPARPAAPAEPTGEGGGGFVLPKVAPPALPEELLKDVDADEQVNVRVYAAVNRSVVNITTSSESVGFFGEETSSGTGSGFVIDRRGHILTNYHVVEGARSVQVTLHDGSNHEAEVVGEDASNDVAVVRVKVAAEKLAPVALGDSSRLLVGQKILAVGNPFGLERTLTTGIISSLDRSLRAKNGRMIKGMIQTDAAINPGNSGGPLLNTRGEVIGMNTAIVSQVGQSAGISFAVPINAIARILKPLIEHGRVIRADLGVTKVFTTNQGLVVMGITDGGPADRAGIRPIQTKVVRYGTALVRRLDPDSADAIVAVDDRRVQSVDELLTEVESHAPGDVVKVTVLRDGKLVDVQVTLGQS